MDVDDFLAKVFRYLLVSIVNRDCVQLSYILGGHELMKQLCGRRSAHTGYLLAKTNAANHSCMSACAHERGRFRQRPQCLYRGHTGTELVCRKGSGEESRSDKKRVVARRIYIESLWAVWLVFCRREGLATRYLRIHKHTHKHKHTPR